MLNTFQAPDILDMQSLAMIPTKGGARGFKHRMVSSQGMHDFKKIKHFDSKKRDDDGGTVEEESRQHNTSGGTMKRSKSIDSANTLKS